jgi:3'-phosphoadenosine 5'-phosphosulfate sulfotransferase (PAPS reductase)/FAD synthetase
LNGLKNIDMHKNTKILVAYSGGKDSLASLIWTLKESPYKNREIEAVFCDTGLEHEETYKHIIETTTELGVKLVVLRSKKYNGMVDLAKKKGRFPSTKARFCTEELKTKPMIDYILDECKCNVIVIQGIRKDESKSRSMMESQCTYFRYYYEPYGYDKKGKAKYHTYRKKDIFEFRKNFLDDVVRPCFNWTGVEVMQYILNNDMKPNPLYYQGVKRVGCFPCIMCSQKELKSMIQHNQPYLDRLKKIEEEVGSTFFPPSYIPKRAMRTTDVKSKKKIATVEDVVRYIKDKEATGDLFKDDDTDRSCMSFYGICE